MITDPQLKRLRAILLTLEEITDDSSRRSFISNALFNYPTLERGKILGRLSFSGRVNAYLNDLLDLFLNKFHDNNVAFTMILKAVAELVSKEDADFIQNLIQQITDTNWKGEDTLGWIQEKIIAEDTLEPFSRIARILQVGAAVIWIESPYVAGADGMKEATGSGESEEPKRQWGTGFLIAEDLILTNNHVLPSRDSVKNAVARLNYDSESSTSYQTLEFDPEGIFITNPQAKYDFTIVQLAKPILDIKPLELSRESVFEGSLAPIIQHPKGRPKQISQRKSYVAFRDDIELQYTTTTMSGSSGSPVFNDDYRVIGVHTGAIEKAKGYYRNRGTRITAILKDLETDTSKEYPAISNRLQIYENL